MIDEQAAPVHSKKSRKKSFNSVQSAPFADVFANLKPANDEIPRAQARKPVLAQSLDYVLQYYWIAIGTVIAALILATVYVIAGPAKFTSTATVYFDPRSSQVGRDSQVGGDFSMASSLVQSQVELIRSERIARAVIDKIGLSQFASSKSGETLDSIRGLFGIQRLRLSPEEVSMGAAFADFQSNLSVTRVSTTFVIQISYVSNDPSATQRITQAVADTYIGELLNSTKRSNTLASAWLQERLDGLRAESQSADRAVQDFRLTSNADPVVLNDLESRSQVARVSYESFLRRFTDVVQQQSFPLTDTRIASDASIPDRAGPRASIVLLLAALVGGALGIGLSVLWGMAGGAGIFRRQADVRI